MAEPLRWLIHALVRAAALAAALVSGQAALGDMVRVTGRAALVPGDIAASQRRALEDALYLAALEGGAEINGFSAMSNGVMAGETVVLRPSSRILDFAIVQQRSARSHYEVTIDAYVGAAPQLRCSARPDLDLTVLRPTLIASVRTPLWMQGALEQAHERTVGAVSRAPRLTLRQGGAAVGAQVAPDAQPRHTAPAGFDYTSLLMGSAQGSAAPVNALANGARGLSMIWRADAASAGAQRVQVSLEARLVDPAAPLRTRTMQFRHTVRLSPGTPWRALNVVARKDQDAVARALVDAFAAKLGTQLAGLACAPLTARLSRAGPHRYRVDLGMRDGLTQQSLAFVEGVGHAWTVLQVLDIAESSAVVAPINAARAASSLEGAQVRFDVKGGTVR